MSTAANSMPDWWEPHTEDPSIRAEFDRNLETLYGGDPRAALVTILETWGNADKGGQYGQMCFVMANEVAKLRVAPSPKQRKK